MPHEARVDVGGDEGFDVVLRYREEGFHAWEGGGEGGFEVFVYAHHEGVGEVELSGGCGGDEGAVHVEHGFGELVEEGVVAVDLWR